MFVITSQDPVPPEVRGAVVALGNFDGFHGGHQMVAGAAARLAASLNAPLAILTFAPHPARFFKPDLPPFDLMQPAQKFAAFKQFGAEAVFVLDFDAALARMSADSFLQSVMIERLGVRGIVTGQDFTYGKNRSGNIAALAAFGAAHGIAVQAVAPVKSPAGDIISSSRIRELLRTGEPREAARLMNRWWRLRGIVAHGDKRGRTIGFPTANFPLGDYLRPRAGVYAVRVHGAARRMVEGVANIGVRPTVAGSEERMEVYLFDFDADIYGKEIDVEIVEFIRDEQKFSGLDALKVQIAGDVATAQKILRQPAYAAARMKVPTRSAFVVRETQDA